LVHRIAILLAALLLFALTSTTNTLVVRSNTSTPSHTLPSSQPTLSSVLDSVELVRGPYLQLGDSDSILVRWRTEQPSTSAVRYGLSLDTMDASITASDVVTDHIMALTDLDPATTYFYSVGAITETLAGPDAEQFFITSPPVGERTTARVWVLGDSGWPPIAQGTRDAYYAYTGDRHTNLWLMLGDNAYMWGTDAEYQEDLFDVFGSMLKKSVLWPTLGNHDTNSADVAAQTGPYFDVFSLPQNGEVGGVPSGTEAYYSFDYANIHFISLDSEKSISWPLGPQPMIDWLESDLAATDQDWVIAFWHHPPYTKGKHDSDEPGSFETRMRERFLPLLEAGGVDLVLSGHSHSYERSYLLDGHYGTSETLTGSMILDGGSGNPQIDHAYVKDSGPHKGAVYVVAGSSSKLASGEFGHPAMYTHHLRHGSVILDVDEDEIRVTFIDFNQIVRDEFTLRKPSEIASEVKYDFYDYVVKPGESLWIIAGKEYGNNLAWIVILRDNYDKIGSEQNKLPVGTVLKLRTRLY
jgi:hypothetical protein